MKLPFDAEVDEKFWNVIYYLGTTGEVTYEGTTVEEDASEDYSEDSYANYTLEFSQHIYPATTYAFSVKLIAPDMDAYGSEEMASEEGIVMCNTKPSKLLGKNSNIYKKNRARYVLQTYFRISL